LFGGTGLESAKRILGLALVVLDARIAWARGNREASIAQWRQAGVEGDRIAYDEPPVWFYPLRESLGGALLASARASDAERVFRDALVRHPRNPRALFGLVETLKAQQKGDAASWVQRELDEVWKNADSQLQIEDL
jgi:hypothetical protein